MMVMIVVVVVVVEMMVEVVLEVMIVFVRTVMVLLLLLILVDWDKTTLNKFSSRLFTKWSFLSCLVLANFSRFVCLCLFFILHDFFHLCIFQISSLNWP